MKTDIELYTINQSRSLRIKHGMSQSELSFKMGLSSGFVGKVESSNTPAKYNLNHLNLLSQIFEVSPQFFLPNSPIK
jgi:transcriptional regulator with XRE-family HTH domain